MSPTVLTEDTLKALEELLGKGEETTKGGWFLLLHDNGYVDLRVNKADGAIRIKLTQDHLNAASAFIRNGAELLRLARIGLETEKDWQP